MIQEIYDWLESRTGSPYDFREEISEIDISDAFLTPIDWFNTISITIERLEECIDDINRFAREIPEDLPNSEDMKKLIIGEVTELMLAKLDEVKKRIGIKPLRVKNTKELLTHLSMLSKIIDVCKSSKIENIIADLTKFEEATGYFMMDNFDITERDYPQLYSDIIDIVEEFAEED